MMAAADKWVMCLTSLGVLFLFAYAILEFYAFGVLVEFNLHRSFVLSNGSDALKTWNTTIDVSIHVYCYNITNPEKAANGLEPIIVKEIGPYVYNTKYNRIQWNEEVEDFPFRDYLTFFNKKSSYFDELTSKPLSDSDYIVIIDFVFISLLINGHKADSRISKMILDNVSTMFPNRSNPFLTVQVKDFLFGGIPMNCHDALKLTPLVCKSLRTAGPSIFWSDDNGQTYFAVLKNHNMTSKSSITINRGLKHLADIEKVEAIAGDLPQIWADPYCNMMNGSQGSHFHSHLSKSEKIYYYEENLCRSLHGVFQRKKLFADIEIYRFEAANDLFAAPDENLANACYCLQTPCLPSGLFPLFPCQGITAFASFPHFYGSTNQSYLNRHVVLTKSSQNISDYVTFAEIEPITGKPVKLSKRYQFNVEIIPIEDEPVLKNMQHTIVPTFWMEEIVITPALPLSIIRQTVFKVKILRLVVIFLPIIGSCLLFAAVTLFLLRSKRIHCWDKMNNLKNVSYGNKSKKKAIKSKVAAAAEPEIEAVAAAPASHHRQEIMIMEEQPSRIAWLEVVEEDTTNNKPMVIPALSSSVTSDHHKKMQLSNSLLMEYQNLFM